MALYLEKKKLAIRSFDPKDLYLNSDYCIKVPIAGVVPLLHAHHISVEMHSTASHTIGNTVGTMGTTLDGHQNNSANRNLSLEAQMGSTIDNPNSFTARHNNTSTTHKNTIPYSSAPMVFSYMCENDHSSQQPRMPQFANQKLHISSTSIPQMTQRISSLYLAPEEISPVTSPHFINQHVPHSSNNAPIKRADFYQEQQAYDMQTCQTQKNINSHPFSQSNAMSPVTKANASRVFSLGMLLL